MAQTQKAAVRDAILKSANELFTDHGYSRTTLSDIAAGADVTVSNIYNYFGTKLEILFALYEPWLDQRLDHLAKKVRRIANRRTRVRAILLALLRDIPMESNGFANNLLQAISTRNTDEPYSRDLLFRSERKVTEMLREAAPESPLWNRDNSLLSHLLFMAFDGFAVNYKLNGPSRRVELICDMLCDMILDTMD